MIKNMTKIILCSLICLFTNTAFAQDVYKMYLSEDELYIEQNDMELQNTNLQAYKMEGKNYYKLRDFAMVMGSTVVFDPYSNTVNIVTKTNKELLNGNILETKDLEVEMMKSDQKLTVDGVVNKYEMYAVAGTNYISFSDLALIYDLNYRWSNEDKKIIICRDSSDIPKSENPESMFGYISDNLEIDCAVGDVVALTNYLDKNLDGFKKELCQVESIHEYTEEGDYLITYTLFHNEIPTPYQVLVFVDSKGGMKYVNKLDGYYDAITTMNHAKRIELTKDELTQITLKSIEGYEDFVIESQEVEVKYDLNMIPYVFVQTTFQMKNETTFVKNFEYYL